MRIGLGFLLPLLTYLCLRLLSAKGRLPSNSGLGPASAAGALVVAAISIGCVLLTLTYARHWPGSTQLAWTGVEVVGQPLVLGGPSEQAVVGWPNESFAPQLKVTSTGKAEAALEILNGEAFVLDEHKGEFINGKVVPDGGALPVGNFTVKVQRSYYLWNSVEVVGADGQAWSSFYLPAVLIRRHRVYALAPLAGLNSAGAVRADAQRQVKLEDWAEGLRLLLTSGGEVRVLGAETYTPACELPCHLSVYWPRRRLPLKITREGAKLSSEFAPPRQLVSQLLEGEGGAWRPLTVTGSPRPGDTAFYLPLGRGVGDVRQELVFKNNADGLPVFDSPHGWVAGEGPLSQLPESIRPEDKSSWPAEQGVTSRVALHAAPHSFHFATVTDLPDYRVATLLSFCALLAFAAGIWLAYPRLPDDLTRWVVFGIAAVIWNLLAYRLLLAFRYALDPSTLDALALGGVRLAFAGLAVVPGLMLLFVRLRRDLFARPASWRPHSLRDSLCYLAALVTLGAAARWQAPRIWANAPAAVGGTSDLIWPLLGLAAAAYLGLMIFILYRSVNPQRRVSSETSWFFFWPFYVVESLAREGRKRWRATDSAAWPWAKWVGFLLAAVLLSGAFLLLLPAVLAAGAYVISKVVVAETFAHDIAIPLLFYWPLVLFWLSSKLAFAPGTRLPSLRRVHRDAATRRVLMRMAVLAVATIFVPVFLLPFSIGDVGSIMGLLALMIPLVLVLLASPPRRLGVAAILSLAIGFAVAALVYVNVTSIAPHAPEFTQVGVARILVFKEGDRVQHRMPFASRYGQLQRLRDGYQHTWENRAIAHEGEYAGLGFNNAPTRRSQVRQDTIQYDSVFSFYVFSEFGLVGAVCLLLVYAVPLALALAGGRSRFDLGYAVACIVFSSFLFEALIHAGMNLNIFPFTGRDLPLLTVNSFTDLLRWAILFIFAGQAVLFRYRGQDVVQGQAESFVAPVAQAAAAEPRGKYLVAAGAVASVPAMVLACVAWAGLGVVRDASLNTPFNWGGILRVVEDMARHEFITVTPDFRLEFRAGLPISPGMLIEQEVARFNAMPKEERAAGSGWQNFDRDLGAVGDRAAYDRLFDGLRQASWVGRERRQVGLFELRPPLRWDDGQRVVEVGGPRVVPNPAFNTQLSFTTKLKPEDLPRVTFRDGREVLIGPAWVSGRWVQLYNPDPPIPWTDHLSGALKSRWSSLGADAAAAAYGTLTIDRQLQSAADEFASTKGRALHDRLLRAGSPKTAEDKLPPRVALSILQLPTGEVLALGGWPRATSGRFWKKSADGSEWLPPSEWVGREAPRRLRTFYGGDRNFDPIVVGSASKPLWAAAALRVHPGLDKLLSVRGPETFEWDVFGIEIAGPESGWKAGPRDWVTFNKYMAISDNRYHVRLGFLGLADKDGGEVVGTAPSGSAKESLKGQPPGPWGKYPAFPPEINFSHLQRGPMRRLNETPLAKHMLNMYGVGVTKNQIGPRLSFWTLDEGDDLRRPNEEGTPVEAFRGISPPAVDLELDRLTGPRDFVTLLLGGGTNLWANVDFAAAFGTCLTGRPVLGRFVRGAEPPRARPEREEFTDTARVVRQALLGVVGDQQGTAHLPQLTAPLTALSKPQGTRIYAKTGTLLAQEGERATSRILLAFVVWEDERQGKVKNGLVISLVGEQAGAAASTVWLGEFLSRYKADIERLLAEVPTRP